MLRRQLNLKKYYMVLFLCIISIWLAYVYNFNKKEITLFYENSEEISIPDFRKTLSTQLPKYMIPSSFFRENELKRNTNGKIDRLYYKELVN